MTRADNRLPHTVPDSSGRSTAVGAIRMVVGEGLALPTGLLAVAFMTRRFGPEGFGLFTLASSVVLCFELAIVAFFSRATIRCIGAHGDLHAVMRTVSRLRLVVDLSAMVALWLGAPAIAGLFAEPELVPVLRLFSVDIPVYGRAQVFRDALVGTGQYTRAALGACWRWIIRLILIVILVEAGLSVPGAVLASIGASLAAAAIQHVRIGGTAQPSVPFPVRSLLTYSVPLFWASVSMLLLSRMDLFMLKALGTSTAEVGVYGAAQGAALALGLVGQAVSPVLLSSLSRSRARGDAEGAAVTVRNGLRSMLYLAPAAALVSASSGEIVRFLFGPGFEAAGPVLAMLIFAALMLLVSAVGSSVLTAAGRPGLVLALSFPALLLAAMLHILMIPRYGAMGGAGVTLAVSTLMACAVWWAVHRSRGTSPALSAVLSTGAVAVVLAVLSRLWPATGLLVVLKVGTLASLGALLLVAFRQLEPGDLRILLDGLARPRPDVTAPGSKPGR